MDNISRNCCGCGVCAAVCPTSAISLFTDEYGFICPVTNKDKCISCGKCDKFCAAAEQSTNGAENKYPECYVALNVSDSELMSSTSGAIFTALSDYVIGERGVVWGAAYDDDMKVRHIRAVDTAGRNRMRGSKYVWSDISSVFASVGDDLKSGLKVLFTGTPCQVAALKKYLLAARCTGDLITCDIACFGTPSPLVFKEHLSMIERKYHKKITDYQHRPSKYGFDFGVKNDLVIFDDGTEVYDDPWIKAYRQLFYMNVTKRECCYNCKYTSFNRVSDITIGDCRNAAALVPDWDIKNGVSTVLVSTPAGADMFNAVSDKIKVMIVQPESITQPPFEHPSLPSKSRESFFALFNSKGYKHAVKATLGKHFALKHRLKKVLSCISSGGEVKK